jgi:hypothetical protein
MGGSGDVGLILGLGIDASGVEPGLDDAGKKVEDFNKLLDDATEQQAKDFEAASQEMDKGLLSNRESARLLSEEFGVHMPRAVSGAVAEILPDIGKLGGALLGIYAAKELYAGISKFTDWIRESFAEQTADAQAFAKAAASAYQSAQKAAEETFTHFKTVEAGAFNIADIDARAKHLEAVVKAFHELADKAGGDIRALGATDAEALKVIAEGAKEGINSLEDAEKRLAEAGQLQFAARRRMAEVQKETDKEALQEGRELDKLTAKTGEEITKNTMTLRRWHEEVIHGGQEAGKVAAELARHNDEATASAIRAARAELEFALNIDTYGIAARTIIPIENQLLPAVTAQTTETKHLSAARKELIGITQDLEKVEQAFQQAMHGETDALEGLTEDMGEAAEAVAGDIQSKKLQAEVHGALDVALAGEEMAKYIASYGTDTAALLSSIKYAATAVQMFQVAGKGSSSGAGTAGGAGGGGVMGGSSGPQAPGAMGTEVPMTPGYTAEGGPSGFPSPPGGGGPNITVHVYGPAQEAAHIAGVLNNYTQRQGGQLIASRAIQPPRAGR